jgi:hypothetical protein
MTRHVDDIHDDDIDHSPVEQRELVGWYSVGVAAQGILGIEKEQLCFSNSCSL